MTPGLSIGQVLSAVRQMLESVLTADYRPGSPDITAVICTYDRYDLLQKAVDSLRSQTLARMRFEVMIVDNSPDLTRAEAEKARYEREGFVTYIVERTPGLSNARNVALRQCRSPIISYLDDDAIAHPGWLEKTLDAFDAFPGQAGVVGGKINPMWAAPRPGWLADSMLGCLTVVDWGGPLRIAAPNEWVAGANISFLAAPLREIGGFPTNLGRVGSGNILLSNEEIRVLAEMRTKGLKVIYAPEAEVDHLVDVRRLDQSWLRKRMVWQAVSDFIKDADVQGLDAKARWRDVAGFVNTLPPRQRTPRAFFQHCEDAGEFERQVGCIYNLSMVLLSGMTLGDEE